MCVCCGPLINYDWFVCDIDSAVNFVYQDPGGQNYHLNIRPLPTIIGLSIGSYQKVDFHCSRGTSLVNNDGSIQIGKTVLINKCSYFLAETHTVGTQRDGSSVFTQHMYKLRYKILIAILCTAFCSSCPKLRYNVLLTCGA